jgi:hypothetical protein
MRALAVCVLVIFPLTAGAQRSVTLTTPDAEFPEAFSVISGVRPLRDGRVIVADSKEKTVQLVDFAGTAKPIGRDGRGPGEWLLPNALVALGGDTTVLWDGGNRRYLRIRPNGTPADDFAPQSTNFGPFSTLLPRGTDARGNIYFEGSPFITQGGTPAAAESVAVMRFEPARGTVDTVAFVRPARGNAKVTAFAEGPGITNGSANPLTPLDDWVVLPNGQVAVVRGTTYRVDFYLNRVVKLSGPPAKFEPRLVDADVKAEITEQRARQFGNRTPRTGTNGQVSTPPAGAVAEMAKQFMNLEPWPATTPPFFRGAAIARASGAAPQVWVRRAHIKDNEPTRYDVFDELGRMVAQVQLPPNTRIGAFGAERMVYVIRTDADDLQYLQRYRLPALP